MPGKDDSPWPIATLPRCVDRRRVGRLSRHSKAHRNKWRPLTSCRRHRVLRDPLPAKERGEGGARAAQGGIGSKPAHPQPFITHPYTPNFLHKISPTHDHGVRASATAFGLRAITVR